jgi:hypothetical protein
MKLRDTIEEPWQEWEMGQLLASPDVAQGEAQGSLEGYKGLSVQTLKEALKSRCGCHMQTICCSNSSRPFCNASLLRFA